MAHVLDLRDLVQTYTVGRDRASVTITGTTIGGIGGVVSLVEAERNAGLLRDAIAARYEFELARQAPLPAPKNERERFVNVIAAFAAELLAEDALAYPPELLELVSNGLEELRAQLAAGRRPTPVVVGGAEGGQLDDSKSAAE